MCRIMMCNDDDGLFPTHWTAAHQLMEFLKINWARPFGHNYPGPLPIMWVVAFFFPLHHIPPVKINARKMTQKASAIF